jgi:very-short-patch-repair endonuclease
MKRPNIKNCRKLRCDQTDAENKLWSILRNRQLSGVKFRRQFPVDRYILDFYSSEYKLGIEADGGQHYEDEGIMKDAIRTEVLSGYGIKILRFSDLDILNNLEGVCEEIQKVIEGRKK